MQRQFDCDTCIHFDGTCCQHNPKFEHFPCPGWMSKNKQQHLGADRTEAKLRELVEAVESARWYCDGGTFEIYESEYKKIKAALKAAKEG